MRSLIAILIFTAGLADAQCRLVPNPDTGLLDCGGGGVAGPPGAGITTLNTLTALTQTFAVGTAGTDFNVSSASSTHTINCPTASSTIRGCISTADWTIFNAKESALTFSAPLARSTNTISIPAATSGQNGYLSSTDWITFNAKESHTAYLTFLGGLAASDDTLIVNNGTSPQLTSLPTCSNATTSKLLYNTSTNAFTCGTDQDTGGGGGVAFSSTVAVTFGATPTFTVPSTTTTGATFKITLTGNVTSSTLASATNGQMLNWIICQDATGGRSFVWPTNVVNGATISAARNSAPSMCVKQTFAYDGTNAYGDREIVVGGSGALTIDANNQIDFTSGVTPSLAGNNTFTGLNYFQNFLRLPNSNTPPSGDCDDSSEQGRLYVDNDASTGQKLYVCKGAAGWEQQGGGSASELGGSSSYAFLQTFDPIVAGSVVGANAISPSASQIYFYRMVVPHKLSITKASFYQGNDVASSKFGIGIYNSSLARVYQTGAVDGSSGSGGRAVTTSIVTLDPDVYIIAWAASDITQTIYSGTVGSVGVTGNLGSVPISGTASGTFSTSTGMPATISSLSGSGVNVPFITFTQ